MVWSNDNPHMAKNKEDPEQDGESGRHFYYYGIYENSSRIMSVPLKVTELLTDEFVAVIAFVNCTTSTIRVPCHIPG